MTRNAARLALGFSLLGLGASAAAAYTHYRLLVDPSYLSFCDVSATVSCTQVYSSPYGSFAGIPVAVFGTIWFAVATLLSVAGMTARPEVGESVPGYLFAGSTLALAVVLYLGYASFALLGVVCVLCLATYVGTIGLFLVSGAATSIPMMSLPGRIGRDLKVLGATPLALILTLVVAGVSVWALAAFPRHESLIAGAGEPAPPNAEAQRAEFERWYTSQPRFDVAAGTLPADKVGKEGARVLVVKFNDYQCPACGQTYSEYKPIEDKFAQSHPGQVRWLTRDFPLDRECNSAVTTEFHAAACEAAAAVRLAREHGTAEVLEKWIYDNQRALTPQLVRQAARDVGKITDFDARYAATLELVKADVSLARQFGVQSTPTFLINGVKIEGGLPIQYFEQAIAFELQRAAP